MVAEQLSERSLAHQGIILEPVGRNTAPAIAVAALHAEALGQGDELLLVLPADHLIPDVPAYHRALEQARVQAEQGRLVTFGVVPQHPETGYGYIRRGASMAADGSAFQVFEFVEKPDLSTAEGYVENGEYYWNSGMFLFRASRYLEELAQFEPEMVDACRQALAQSRMDLDFVRLDETAFTACPERSVDYAVMEKTSDAVVVPLDAAWSDVGAWSALWEVGEKSAAGNAVQGDVILEATSNSYVYAGSRLVTTLGVDNLVVVETADAVLVADKSRVQDVKRIVQQLVDQNRPEVEQHREVYRPWGCFDSIDNGERYQVKRLVVNPGASLSLQKHFHRAEHWIVVKGTALVICNDETRLLTENESAYLPLGCLHRLENPGRIPLHLIEVQTGAYLGEDDIVRLDDPYHRQDNDEPPK
jgi:mannose-1-phosphate guanylyltransferase/mannose-6-phosphate isomerase